MSAEQDYWEECISIAAEECDLTLTKEQLGYLADYAQRGHENYGMAFYSPPASDHFYFEQEKLKKKIKQAELETERVRENFIKNICMRNKCDPSQVQLEDDGHATILY